MTGDVCTCPGTRQTNGISADTSPAPPSEPYGLISILANFSVASVPGNEKMALWRVAEVVESIGLSTDRVEQLKTAVGEAAMNAIEHGNQSQPEIPVEIQVLRDDTRLVIEITDQGGGPPPGLRELPDLEQKLAGLQTARGWGLFLIENMVDELHRRNDGSQQTVTLVIYLPGDQGGSDV